MDSYTLQSALVDLCGSDVGCSEAVGAEFFSMQGGFGGKSKGRNHIRPESHGYFGKEGHIRKSSKNFTVKGQGQGIGKSLSGYNPKGEAKGQIKGGIGNAGSIAPDSGIRIGTSRFSGSRFSAINEWGFGSRWGGNNKVAERVSEERSGGKGGRGKGGGKGKSEFHKNYFCDVDEEYEISLLEASTGSVGTRAMNSQPGEIFLQMCTLSPVLKNKCCKLALQLEMRTLDKLNVNL